MKQNAFERIRFEQFVFSTGDSANVDKKLKHHVPTIKRIVISPLCVEK